jgi:hypothetical protein
MFKQKIKFILTACSFNDMYQSLKAESYIEWNWKLHRSFPTHLSNLLGTISLLSNFWHYAAHQIFVTPFLLIAHTRFKTLQHETYSNKKVKLSLRFN